MPEIYSGTPILFRLGVFITDRNAERLPVGLANPLPVPQRDALTENVGRVVLRHQVVSHYGLTLPSQRAILCLLQLVRTLRRSGLEGVGLVPALFAFPAIPRILTPDR